MKQVHKKNKVPNSQEEYEVDEIITSKKNQGEDVLQS